ncbi:TPA: hypothetical protein QCS32_001344 [Bacillus thuringiensis]|uniref:Uncharacterized protein n=1 Tax=Bacillus thuringiensis serovar iberica TaxID=180866 RepID=A0A9X6LBB8_BACTU|nr:hypothetical protein [Bacillus thuringiensis]MEB9622862.1 hypothetical protein [Bacillus cereus]OUB40411.1 hypothetical protein BK741_31980 [Bacillus thuringiensis serovar iberica]HDR5349731.1 hypothetical protein [Bacillus thuringiensis]HDX9634860.1 hypothetical protein [Bacillus cereus]
MIERKSLYIANFNCTFGKENKPMLDYFEEIVMPAFQQPQVRESDGNKYFFDNVKLIMVKGEFMLGGLLIKRTKLEVKSLYTEGKLTLTNEIHPSDPYSYFLINLKNHRMVLVKNQKGSPNLGNFSATAKYVLKDYVSKINRDIEDKEERLPAANLNIVAIPFKDAIRKEMRNVKKIQNVILRFYPLNGDIDGNEVFTYMREMLEEVDSKSGYTQINTPDNRENVINLLDDTNGLVRPTLRVVYNNGSARTLRDDSFTEEMQIQLEDTEDLYENLDSIAGRVINEEQFTDTSEENQNIYERWFGKLMSIFEGR